MPYAVPVDWDVVQQLRQEANDDLQAEKKRLERELTAADEEQLARTLVQRRVAAYAPKHALNNAPLTREQVEQLREAVFDALFRAGPMQRLLNLPDVENLVVDSAVHAEFNKQSGQIIASPFEGSKELVAWINEMARGSGHGERQLSASRPMVDFTLPDGSRAAATTLTRHPTVAIRKDRLKQLGLGDLARLGTVDPLIAHFLLACVKAPFNLLIAGDMNAGKTTLMRALGREIPSHERVATLESDRELNLDLLPPGQGPHVLSFEARGSNGEVDANGHAVGEVSLADLVPVTLRYSAKRVMVGEVRSVEALPMLEVMSAGGSGSMCTIHARDPEVVVDRLMVPLTREGLTDNAAYRQIASALDFIIYIELIDETDLEGGRMHRFVSHIWEVTGLSEGGGVALGRVFAPSETDPRATFHNPPTQRRLTRLARRGFDRRWLGMGTQWPPLELVVPL